MPPSVRDIGQEQVFSYSLLIIHYEQLGPRHDFGTNKLGTSGKSCKIQFYYFVWFIIFNEQLGHRHDFGN